MQDTESLLGHCRVLIATIQDKGSCPCPQCLVPKTDLYRISFLSDMFQRILKVCSYLCNKVAAAQAVIYNAGAPIKGSVPEAHLKGKSLVPTFVSGFVSIYEYMTHTIKECVRRKARIVGMQHISHPRCQPPA